MSGLDPFQYLDVGFPYSDLYDGSFVCVAWIGRVRFIPGCFENNQCGKLRLIFRAGSCNCQVPPSDSVPSAPKALPAAPSSSGSMWSGQCGVLYTTALQFVHSGPVLGLLVATARFAMT